MTLRWESGSCDVRIYEIQQCGSRRELSVDNLEPNDNLELAPMENGGSKVELHELGNGGSGNEMEKQVVPTQVLKDSNAEMGDNETNHFKVQNTEMLDDELSSHGPDDAQQQHNSNEEQEVNVDVGINGGAVRVCWIYRPG